ncbi:hypothetical protein [uncultured Tenacibaculum sp.]|uniref:hypothetical protein n=1 Tax=uncultured Tenacibaculum sp. TaxID=174713 RepID=UPI00261B74FC|nr:hypothetical protein [uncultured Tenacibaculum sp.]
MNKITKIKLNSDQFINLISDIENAINRYPNNIKGNSVVGYDGKSYAEITFSSFEVYGLVYFENMNISKTIYF